MEVMCVGVGAAYDKRYPNNSHLVTSKKTNLLLDCGHSAGTAWSMLGKDPNFLDAVFISHSHDDHYLGIRPVLAEIWREGRKKPIAIICQEKMKPLLENYLKWVEERLQILWLSVQAGEIIELNDLELSFAATMHKVPNLGIRVSDGVCSMCYSGDGDFTPEIKTLYTKTDLLIQSACFWDKKEIGHACIKETIVVAEEVRVKRLACTHLNSKFRQHELVHIRPLIKSSLVEVTIPEPGQIYKL